MNLISCFFLCIILSPLLTSCQEKQVYIVHFSEHNGKKTIPEIEDSHRSYLQSVKVKDSREDIESSLLYSYKHAINGFAAELTSEEASKLSELEQVMSVFPTREMEYGLHTTRSWEFVGLEELAVDTHSKNQPKRGGGGEELLARARYGKDVIIGVLDTGVWPESPSFSDEEMEDIPKSWKGVCQEGLAFNSSHCNKKIIGARYYAKGFERVYKTINASEDCKSPRDMDGHGSHTASTAAGRQVPNAGALGGFAKGMASGGAPLSRLAIYKVCWAIPNKPKVNGNLCMYEDILAGMDDAIADGVDIMSISIGSAHPETSYEKDTIALGALHAAKHNILVVCSAGNSGPAPGTLSNQAPWIMTVAASSLDRQFSAPVTLGNGKKIMGQSIAPYKLGNHMYPLLDAKDAVLPNVAENLTEQCLPDSLDSKKVKGKIVMCWRGNGTRVGKGVEVKKAGGVGFILANSIANGNELSVDSHVLPATAVTYNDAVKILKYYKSTKKPKAKISPAKTELNHKPAPLMAGFSSQGPNVIDPNILKPDITAPGINILAAWSGASSPTKLDVDHRSVKYNIFSGTSMSCPHVSGAAALLKAIHPDWSIAAIKSALMTTASITNNLHQPITDASGKTATPFQFGSGHFQPIKAADPGLIYDASHEDYLLYLCSISQNSLNPSFKCPANLPSALNLNYPSFAIPNLNGSVTFTRTVTNVGKANSKYMFAAKPPKGVLVEASPSILFFKHIGEKQSFNITVKPRKLYGNVTGRKYEYVFGWYTWNDGFYHVRSSMAVYLA